MKAENIWAAVKTRYRLSSRTQMKFELSFPKYLIGKCRLSTNTTYDIRTKKISLSLKGVVFSDTIPLSWFTSSAFIPWEKVVKIIISDKPPFIEDGPNTPSSPPKNKQTLGSEYCTLQLHDPQEMTIDFPWSKDFADYAQTHKIFDG